MPKSNRKKLYVDASVQMQLLRRIVLHWFTFIVVAVVLAMSFQLLFENPFQSLSSLTADVLSRNGLLLIILLALIPVFVYDTVKLSNRFAGPMLRFRRAMRTLADGESMEPLTFRDGDFWQELASDFNRVVARVQEQESTAATEADQTDSSELQCVES
jgi:methyl-accepting chemotaxis protein